MPTSGSGREGRRHSHQTGAVGLEGNEQGVRGSDKENHQKGSERRDKAKSSQYYGAAKRASAGASRRGSVQPGVEGVRRQSEAERPRAKGRVNSAPLIEVRSTDGRSGGLQVTVLGGPRRAGTMVGDEMAPRNPTVEGAVDEDEAAGVTGAVRQYQSFQSSQVSEPLPELNIAVIGAEGVGKSTFVQKALDLPTLPLSQAAERKVSIEGGLYLVRLLELSVDDVYVDDDDTVGWSDTIEDKVMPKIDGAIALYDVQDRESFEDLPEVLTAIRKASLPSLLVSAKCDVPAAERELDPCVIEQKARRSISGIGTLQTSQTGNKACQQAMAVLFSAIVSAETGKSAQTLAVDEHTSATRTRSQTNAARPISPRPLSSLGGHARASSEYTGSLYKEGRHARHDSSIAAFVKGDSLRVPGESPEDVRCSFLFEESASDDGSRQSTPSSLSGGTVPQVMKSPPRTSMLAENGANFDELIDRLLAQPVSKADSKFSAVFLALYRKFAAPSRLLEAITERFDRLEKSDMAQMMKTVAQLRYLAILEQWIGQYPGDFAYPKTKRRMQMFVTKTAQVTIFTVAAKEISGHLEIVQQDDDTEWACCDKDRAAASDQDSAGSRTSTLLDDPRFSFMDSLSGTTLVDDRTSQPSEPHPGKLVTSLSAPSLSTTSQILAHTTAAQKAATLFPPAPRIPLTKLQWRALEAHPDEVLAKDLTRLDAVLIASIRPRDLVRHASTASPAARAPFKNLANVSRYIDHFNRLAAAVKNYILLRDKPKHRALMLEKFMRVGRKLRELNNYNALGAVIAGINSSCVQRLAATRDLISPAAGKDFARLELLMNPSKSHAAYRLAWENTSTERIPYLPLHLRDLASAEQGSATLLASSASSSVFAAASSAQGDRKTAAAAVAMEPRVNWRKFEIMGDVVVGLQRAQGVPYQGLGEAVGVGTGAGGSASPGVKELVLDVRLEMDEDILYQRSIQLEPAPGASGPSDRLRRFLGR